MMKTNRTIVVFVALLAMLSFVSAAGEIVTKGGKLGVGITNPTAKLHVYDNAQYAAIKLTTTTNGYDSGILSEHETNVGQRMFLGAYNPSGFVSMLTIRGNGNVGIGTTSPNYPFSLGGAHGDRLAVWDSGPNTLYGFGIQSGRMYIKAGGTEAMNILAGSGNVGIGTNSPTIKLAVGDSDSGLHSSGDGEIGLFSNGAERIRAAANGDVWVFTGSVGTSRAFIWYGPNLAQGQGRDATLSISGMGARTTFIRTGANYGYEGNKLVFETKKSGNNQEMNTNQLVLYNDGNVGIGKLTGTGTDYACLNSEGTIIRSNSAC